jgi:hypothetical protein
MTRERVAMAWLEGLRILYISEQFRRKSNERAHLQSQDAALSTIKDTVRLWQKSARVIIMKTRRTNFVTLWLPICLPYLIVANKFAPQHSNVNGVVVANVFGYFCHCIRCPHAREEVPPPSKGRLHAAHIWRDFKDHSGIEAS